VTTGERVALEDLPPDIAAHTAATIALPELAALTWVDALEKGREEVAKRYLEEVLSNHEGHVAEAAVHAGVERESFYRLMRRYGVDADVHRFQRGHRPLR
jgi:two-component system response regulator HydG